LFDRCHGVHGVGGGHALHADRIGSSDANIAHHDFTCSQSAVSGQAIAEYAGKTVVLHEFAKIQVTTVQHPSPQDCLK
ncbi:MAG: hypothetical protein RLZZ630_1913, partial [Bacteroidota bacterium]